MRYAEVAVDAPIAHSRTFSYSIPPRFSVEPGQLVWVPFGRRVAQGVVVELVSAPQVEVTRDILQPIEPTPLVLPLYLDLAKWLSGYYLCSLFAAISPMLPPGFEAQVRSKVYPGRRISGANTEADPEQADISSLRPQSLDALASLAESASLREAEFIKLLGRNGERELVRLIEKGLVFRQTELPRPRVAPKYESFLFSISREKEREQPREVGHEEPPESQVEERPEEERLENEAENLPRRQRELLLSVREQGSEYRTTLANKEFGVGTADSLVRKGFLGREWVRLEPAALTGTFEPGEPQHVLTPEQAKALASIIQDLDSGARLPSITLLHGVTGSGKTEVYLRAIEHVVKRGQQAIFLVPEIALTPQTMQRVNAKFPGRTAVLHSRMTQRQQFDQWWKIRDGLCDVVVGPRSSLFGPIPNLGLIVIDEEHEWTYKQEEAHPFYHARTVAFELARLTGASVVLGSATPDVETYYRASRGLHRLIELPRRIGPATEGGDSPGRFEPANGSGVKSGDPGLASVEIRDMRTELREGNRSMFSRALAQALQDCVQSGHQAILFLNRRGNATYIQCRACGHVATCARCSVTLSYHSVDNRLLCHRCGRRARAPVRCPQCAGTRIRNLGVGTQKVVLEVEKLLPGARVERWDADATRTGFDSQEAMERLNSGQTQVLVGTQMVAKGLDVPNVTLVGVILADVGLYLPDFRAGERAFSLLCQVAGRAGRGADPGRVIVQTYTPEHYVIAAAAQQDYGVMFRREINLRRQLGNPPFNQMVHMIYQDVNANMCQRQAVTTARELRRKADAQGLTDVEIIGPAPGIPSRLRGRFRWHLILRGRNLQRFLEDTPIPTGCIVDVDPAHVL